MIRGIIHKFYKLTKIESQRTKNITKHVVLSFIYKGGSIIANFLLVPLTMDYLDVENYGVWLTLSSFIAWFTFFDIGLGNGLRNKFAEAKAKGELLLAQAYVSSAYYTIGTVCLILTVLFFLLNYFVDWTKVFNTSRELSDDLRLLMPIAFGFFCLQLVTKLITTIYTADQHHSMQGKVNFFVQAGSLFLIWILTLTSNGSLFLFGTVYSFLPVLVLFVLNLIAFTGIYKDFKPTLIYWKKKYLRDIFGLGLNFFIVQMAWVIITSTDNIIISVLFSPEEVVPFNIALKLFSAGTMVFTIIVSPYWSSFTEAYVKGDLVWIKNSMRNLKKFIFVFCCLSLLLLLISNYLYKIWIGQEVQIPFMLSALICVYSCLIMYITPFNYFINGIGKIRLQLYQSVIMAGLNIPVSIFFSLKCDFGVNGVILGTIFCTIPGAILSTLQFNKIINKRAIGIWNK